MRTKVMTVPATATLLSRPSTAMILWSVADEKLVVKEMLPSGLTRAVLASVIPTCCTGGTVGLQDAAGDGVGPPEPVVKPPTETEGSEPSEESWVAEVPDTVECEAPPDAADPGTVAPGTSALPAEVEPSEEPAVGVLPLQAVSETASTRSEAVSQRDPAFAAPAPKCPTTVHPPTTPRTNARHPRSRIARRRPQLGIAWHSRAGVVQCLRCLKRRTTGCLLPRAA